MPTNSKILVDVSVSLPKLTPRALISIGHKLNSPPIQTLLVQIRKRHLREFRLDLGDGVIVQHPPGDGLVVRLN